VSLSEHPPPAFAGLGCPVNGRRFNDLRAARLAARISLQTVADALGSWPTRISELERGLKHDTALARRYDQWLDGQLHEGGEESLQAA
jgi:transcriptional regulator with XRE-family HTH domain